MKREEVGNEYSDSAKNNSVQERISEFWVVLYEIEQ